MAEQLYVDPHHRLSDADWAAVVARAEEITREAAEAKAGGASPVAAPVIEFYGRSDKHSGISGIPTQLLVLHSAECPLMPGYAQSLTEWAITSTVVASWHRFIGPDSRVYMIEDQYAAWHASEANPMSIGWEQAGYARYTRDDWTTPNGLLQLESLAYDMAMVALREGIPAVWLSTAQVTAVTTHGDRTTKGFCLHRQIDPETRTDPGDGYPYDLLMSRIRAYMGGAVAPAGTTTTEKESEMPESKRLDSAFTTRHRLPKGSAYTLSVKDDGAPANFALNGIGHYLIHTHVRGEGLLPGQKVKAQYWLTVDGKPSGHHEQDITGSIDGSFDQVVVLNRKIASGTLISCKLTSVNTETAYVTGFGAEITTWK